MTTRREDRQKRIFGFLGPALTVIFIASYLLWTVAGYIIFHLYGFVLWGSNPAATDFVAQGLRIDHDANAHGAGAAKIPPQIVCTLFVTLNIVRVWMGLTFLHSDRSFRRSVRRAKAKNSNLIRDIERKNLFASVALFIVYLLLGLAARNAFGIWGLCLIFVMQSLLLIYIDQIWWRILITRDIEKAANKFIVIGDAVVFMFSIFLLWFLVFAGSPYGVDPHWESGFFIFFLGALLFVFIGECWSQYILALRLAIRRAFRP